MYNLYNILKWNYRMENNIVTKKKYKENNNYSHIKLTDLLKRNKFFCIVQKTIGRTTV